MCDYCGHPVCIDPDKCGRAYDDEDAMTDAFDLLIPSSGEGPTHLRDPQGGGIICGDYTVRYATFTMAGIVPAGTATCASCRRRARGMVANP